GFAPAPGSDLARSLGLGAAPARGKLSVSVDAMTVSGLGVAVNSVVVGPPPGELRWWHRSWGLTVICDGAEVFRGRAATVVVATGQFVGGHDVIPRAHPGDGWLEVQVYAVPRGQRAELRRRLQTGSHLPHPNIVARRARAVSVEAVRPTFVTLDGVRCGKRSSVAVDIWPAACRLAIGAQP
ncbi:MAG: hypothetical protein HYU28_11840, partial [Actinobacteria bacterium]|nr:hypothetical protein [Actinomycetota bacterium]